MDARSEKVSLPIAVVLGGMKVARRCSFCVGHFGAVYLARAKRADGFLLALKCLQKSDIERNGSETQVRREIEVS